MGHEYSRGHMFDVLVSKFLNRFKPADLYRCRPTCNRLRLYFRP